MWSLVCYNVRIPTYDHYGIISHCSACHYFICNSYVNYVHNCYKQMWEAFVWPSTEGCIPQSFRFNFSWIWSWKCRKGGKKLSNFLKKILSMHKLTQDLPSSAIQNMEPWLASKLLSCTFPGCWAHCCSLTCNYGCQTKATTHVWVAVFIFFLISKVNAAELCSRTKCLAATERFLSS